MTASPVIAPCMSNASYPRLSDNTGIGPEGKFFGLSYRKSGAEGENAFL